MPPFERDNAIAASIRTRVVARPCPERPRSAGEPIVTIKVFREGAGTDVQVDFQRDPKHWLVIREALAAVKEKIERDFSHEQNCPAKPKGADHG
jgi:hypothetical protein